LEKKRGAEPKPAAPAAAAVRSAPAVAPYRPGVPPDMSKMNAAEKKARREALRAVMFSNKNDEFVARHPGDLNGSAFQVMKSDNAQLYLHDYVAQTTVD